MNEVKESKHWSLIFDDGNYLKIWENKNGCFIMVSEWTYVEKKIWKWVTKILTPEVIK